MKAYQETLTEQFWESQASKLAWDAQNEKYVFDVIDRLTLDFQERERKLELENFNTQFA